MIRGFLAGIIMAVIGAAVGMYCYFSSGRAPVAVTAPAMPFERRLARIGLHAYLDKLPHPEPQVPSDERNLLGGAKVYKEHCAVCHGVPEGQKTAIAEGMFPKPPQLFKGTGVTDDDAWESYWKIAGGIRMTGMPGFKNYLSETQMWQVAVLVKNADKISAAVKAELTGSAGSPEASNASKKN
jgi:mono/diheme cytochrome c family protein